MMMVLAFMFTMSSVMVAMSRSLTIARGGRAADQAYLNAVTGLELGLYKQNKPDTFNQLASAIDSTYYSSANNGPVTIAPGSTVTFKVTDDIAGGGKVCANKSVTDIAQCPSDKLYYVYPFPGTGTLGNSGCNVKNPPQAMNEQWYRDAYFFLKGVAYTGTQDLSPTTKTSNGNVTPVPIPNPNNGIPKKDYSDGNIVWYIQNELETLDHPCLWNKLEPGNAAEIPLSNNPDDLKNLSELWLRVRLPCTDGVLCGGPPSANAEDPKSERMKLYVLSSNTKADTERALLWEIVSNCKKGNEDSKLCYLRDVKSSDIESLYQGGTSKAESENSLIHKLLLKGKYGQNPYKNQSIANIVLGLNVFAQSSDSKNFYTKIADFLTGKSGTAWENLTLIKPAMHLSIATDLYTGTTGKELIPSVEFQLLYKPVAPYSKPIISNPTVISTGQNGGYTINLESSLTKQIGTYGYALIGK